jgi:hypothetical protein
MYWLGKSLAIESIVKRIVTIIPAEKSAGKLIMARILIKIDS